MRMIMGPLEGAVLPKRAALRRFKRLVGTGETPATACRPVAPKGGRRN